MSDIERAKLGLSGNTICLVRGDEVITSTRRGVAPMLELIERGQDLTGFAAADKVIGRAAALLFAYCGVSEVYAEVISLPAAAALEECGIPYSYGKRVENVINREGTGICPMEKATLGVSAPSAALAAIKAALSEMRE